MSRVCVIGSIAADIVLHVAVVPAAGEHARATARGWRPGGSSANLARALSSAGHEVTLVSGIGMDELGRMLRHELEEWGVTFRCGATTQVSPRALVLVDSEGERTILDITHSASLCPRLTIGRELVQMDAIYVENFAVLAPQFLDALDRSKALVVAAAPVSSATVAVADLLIGSAADVPLSWLAAPYDCAVSSLGERLKWVVITDGKRGAVAAGPHGKHVQVPALTTRQRDATGAGDCFAAGVIHGMLVGADIRMAMRLGAAWAARSVTELQSVPPAWEEEFGLLRVP